MEILKTYPLLEPFAFFGVMVIFGVVVYFALRKTNQLQKVIDDYNKILDELKKKLGV